MRSLAEIPTPKMRRVIHSNVKIGKKMYYISWYGPRNQGKIVVNPETGEQLIIKANDFQEFLSKITNHLSD